MKRFNGFFFLFLVLIPLSSLSSGISLLRRSQCALGNNPLLLAGALPLQTDACITVVLIILYFDVIRGSCCQQNAALPAVTALLLPAVDDQPASDPDADAIIRGGDKGVFFTVQRLDGSGPAD